MSDGKYVIAALLTTLILIISVVEMSRKPKEGFTRIEDYDYKKICLEGHSYWRLSTKGLAIILSEDGKPVNCKMKGVKE